MKKVKCPICGYVHEGDNIPADCPKCKVKNVKWEVIEEKETPAAPPTLAGSKTEANLREAFAGESMATNKYKYFANKARKDGFEQIAAIFEETSANEQEHAELWFKYLSGGSIPHTPDNLKAAAAGENFEYTDMYKRMAATAREEGFEEIARKFEMVGAIERTHEERYLRLLHNVENGLVFSRDGDRIWVCRKCGHIHIGPSAPAVCPVCNHPQSFQEIKAENY